ncbi:MAG: AIM24 family protein, partial [Prolixibacteraceae bacterium]|nr:AIM24 family protein [Prolixibacteraceae bacterium]
MRSHEIDYKIIGHDVQLVEVELDPGETVVAEAGTMLYMEPGIDFQTKMGDGSNPGEGLFGKLLKGAGRMLTGESLFLTHFTNRGYGGKSHVAFAGP